MVKTACLDFFFFLQELGQDSSSASDGQENLGRGRRESISAISLGRRRRSSGGGLGPSGSTDAAG